MHWLRAGPRRHEFEQFVTRWTDPLLRTAYLLAGDLAEAEDLVQEALLKVARRWPSVRVMDHPGAYARRILVNLAIDSARQRDRRAVELSWGAGAGLEGQADIRAERDMRAIDTQAILLDALTGLPARQRAVIVLRYWEDLPESEVATVLGCSVGTVKSTASRGLARLRADVGARWPEHPVRGTSACP